MPAPALWPPGTCTEVLGLAPRQAIVPRLCRGGRDLHIPVQHSVLSAPVPRRPRLVLGPALGAPGYPCRGAAEATRPGAAARSVYSALSLGRADPEPPSPFAYASRRGRTSRNAGRIAYAGLQGRTPLDAGRIGRA